MRYAAAALAAITSAVLAGCSTAAPAAAPPSATPAQASSSPATGPFKITPVYCGKFTAAQQNQYGTNAAGGFVYRFKNNSNNLTGAAKADVNFTSGTVVQGDNVSGDMPQVSPGQTGTAEVDAVGGGGQNLSFTGCQVMSYAVVTSSGVLPQQYAP